MQVERTAGPTPVTLLVFTVRSFFLLFQLSIIPEITIRLFFYSIHITKKKTGSKSAEELTKRYLDAVLKSQCSPNDNNSTKSEDEDMENEDIVVSMTPPTSPPQSASLRSSSSVSRHSNSTVATTSTLRDKNITLSTPSSAPSSNNRSQDAPMDLSMKSSSSSSASAKATSPTNDHRDLMSDEDGAVSSEEELSVDKKSTSTDSRPESRNDEKNALETSNGLRVKGTTPLDLTTKI